MKNKYRKGTFIMVVDEDGNDSGWSMWLDEDRDLEKGDTFDLKTTKNATPIKMEVVSDADFPLIVKEL